MSQKAEDKSPKKRKAEINARLEEITKERQSCEESIEELNAQVRKIQEALNAGEHKRDETVKAKMDEIFGKGNHTSKGIVDEVLKLKMSEGSLTQLRDSKAKLRATVKWNVNKKIELENEEKALNAKLADIECNEVVKQMWQHYRLWKKSYFDAERYFEELKKMRAQAHALDSRFHEKFKPLGIDSQTFFNLVTSRIRPENKHTSMLEVIADLARLYGFYDNEFYDDGVSGVRRKVDKQTASVRQSNLSENYAERHYV